MSSNQELARLAKMHIINTYGEREIALVKGQGAKVWDADGNEYLDFLAGIAVNNLGHCHPKVVEAIQKQAETLIHVSNLYLIEPQVKLAELLTQNSFAEKTFFCNSGCEANEGAIKLARRYHDDVSKYEIICFDGSFHGRTLATLSATGQDKYHQQGFDPLVEGFVHVPFNDLEAVKNAINEKTCGILVEPIQGEGGVRPATSQFLLGLREVASDNDLVLIFDEVQCGMGRTGKLFAHQRYGVAPDVMSLAKGLGGGAPIGALLTNRRTADVLTPGTHAHTFGGNPLVCAAAVAVLETMLEPDFLESVVSIGNYFKSELKKLANENDIITDVRGAGLMLGAEVSSMGPEIIAKLMDKRILANCAAGNVLRFLPPLIITKEDINTVMTALRTCLPGGE
jgi:acetylornithine/N-succinyldiaminopimelate aminotransferase